MYGNGTLLLELYASCFSLVSKIRGALYFLSIQILCYIKQIILLIVVFIFLLGSKQK